MENVVIIGSVRCSSEMMEFTQKNAGISTDVLELKRSSKLHVLETFLNALPSLWYSLLDLMMSCVSFIFGNLLRYQSFV